MSLADAKKSLLIRFIRETDLEEWHKQVWIETIENSIAKLKDVLRRFKNGEFRTPRDLDDASEEAQALWRGRCIIAVEVCGTTPKMWKLFEKVYHAIQEIEHEDFRELI